MVRREKLCRFNSRYRSLLCHIGGGRITSTLCHGVFIGKHLLQYHTVGWAIGNRGTYRPSRPKWTYKKCE